MGRAPEDLKAAPRSSEIAVGQDHFDDARDVQLSVESAAPHHLFAPSSGKVTAFPCGEGVTVSSGATPLSVDGSPKLALATAVPLWRDLHLLTRGDDVRAFQDELGRLGFSLSADGVVGQQTLNAAKAAFARIGVKQESDVVSVASLVWIPAATVTMSTCDATVGADVQQGATLASITSESPKVSVIDPPTDLLPGARLVKVGDSDFQGDPNGDVHVADLRDLGLPATPASPDSGTKPIEAQLALADPVAVSVVPPNALYNVNGTAGCVSSKGVGYRVRILGSRLGETLIDFDRPQIPTHVDTPAIRASSCV
jgi:peptidoglycan hydrolase-like protein with peptidoglycan-binding domain